MAAKKELSEEIMIEFGTEQESLTKLCTKVRAQVREDNPGIHIHSLKIYVKPEDNAAYYVVNKKAMGHVALFQE